MRKSNKCSYKIGIKEKKKVKFLKPEEAIKEADFLNSKPNIIKKYVPYKCTVCHFFHIGRSWEDKKMANDIFKNPNDPSSSAELNLKVVGMLVGGELKMNETVATEAVVLEPTIVAETEHVDDTASEPVSDTVNENLSEPEDDFDWDSNKKIIKWKK